MTDDPDLIAALRGLAQATHVPPMNPDRELALLEAFGAAQDRKRARPGFAFWKPALGFALLAVIATGVWMAGGRSRQAMTPPRPLTPLSTTEFVLWPGAAALPTFESGHLMRMEVPVSALPSLGLTAPSSGAPVVQADVLVGQDGLPRAVRLSPDF